jgi:hypothetical protein
MIANATYVETCRHGNQYRYHHGHEYYIFELLSPLPW